MKIDKFTTPVKIEIPGIGTIESKDLLLKVEVEEVIAELEQEIERLKKENEMTFVGVNFRSPTSDGRFV